MLSATNVRKQFDATLAIDSLTFQLPDDRITCLLAPSGAGKSTLLRILAGFERATSGTVTVDDGVVDGPSPKVVLVPQTDTLFPHLRVRRQVAFGTFLRRNRQRNVSEDYNRLVARIEHELGLEFLAERYPAQLSGGQRQRVSLGRALAVQPRYLCCDEPFSGLDSTARQELREVLRQIRRDFRQSILFVTHSVEEAVFLGDEIWLAAGPPLRLVDRLAVSLPAMRSQDTLASEEFLSLCQRVHCAHLRRS